MIGHEDNITAFKTAFSGDRPHHAWLLTGPQGLGKALFARLAATWVLAGRPDVDNFDVDPETPAARFVNAGSHIDFKIIERLESPTTGKLRGEIVIEQLVRRPNSSVTPLSELLKSTPALSDYRVVIIDAADDMNRSVANALLKNLEEPASGTLFLLISHTPGRLLPTIRSRCRTLRFHPLDDQQVDRILAELASGIDDEDRAALVRIALGAPGRALRFAESGIAALEEQLVELATTPPAAAPARMQALARSLAGKANGARYEAFLDLVPAMLAEAARSRRGAALARTMADWEAATSLAASAVALSMDPQAVAFDLAGKVAALAKG